MFESDQAVIATLLEDDAEFRHLYGKHQKLKARVDECKGRVSELDDAALETLKKEKLWLKDQMANKIRRHQTV